MHKKISLNGNDWKLVEIRPNMWRARGYAQYSPDVHAWIPATVPGNVQADLMAAGEMTSEPYRDMNSRLCEWASFRDWGYFKEFEVPADLQGKKIRLHFEGVDYSCFVYLNDELLGEHEGMFTPFEFDVTRKLKYGEQNRLIVFVLRAPDEQSQVGFTSKVKTNKGRMAYSWDFSTRMIPLGIWDDVSLIVTQSAWLTDLWVRSNLTVDFSRAEIAVEATLASDLEGKVIVEAEILKDGKLLESREIPQAIFRGESRATATFTLESPELWWPNNMGDQPLYECRVRVLMPDGSISDERSTTFGIRRIRMIQNEDAPAGALPYTPEINKERMFIKGWNWVPLDHLYGIDLTAKYTRMIQLAKEANVNLIRVWGGGLIEKEIFYRLCDEAGILVWQEFILSSSGLDNKPPTDPAYLSMLRNEVEQIIPRRRNHACLAIWCGGNELMVRKATPIDPTEPAVALMQSIVKRLDPERIFLPTSPSGPVFSGGFVNLGQQHDIHGPWKYVGPVEHYRVHNDGIDGLLHSEFGCEGSVSLKILQRFVSPDKIWPPDRSNPIWVHHGDWWITYNEMCKLFGKIADIQSFIHASQYMQMEGLRYQIEANMRRMWHCSGTIPWQMNEPWPNTCCTNSVDYYTNPKPAYYGVKRAYEPLHISAQYETIQWHDKEKIEARIWLTNIGESRPVKVRALLMGLDGKPLTFQETETKTPNQGAAFVTRTVWEPNGYKGVFMLFLQALGEDGEVLTENFYIYSTFPEPIFERLRNIPGTNLTAETDGNQIILRNAGKSVAVMISTDEEVEPERFVSLSDNYFVIPPGGEKRIAVESNGWSGPLSFKGWNTNIVTVRI